MGMNFVLKKMKKILAAYQYIRYINLCQKVVKSMITWKTINILYFKDAVNFGLQMSLVTD